MTRSIGTLKAVMLRQMAHSNFLYREMYSISVLNLVATESIFITDCTGENHMYGIKPKEIYYFLIHNLQMLTTLLQ